MGPVPKPERRLPVVEYPLTVEPLLGVPRMGQKTPNGNEEIYLGWKGYSWKDLIE